MSTQVSRAHNHFKTSWTQAEADASTKCDNQENPPAQAEADFSSCVDGTVVTNYGTPYDFESVMHYGLTE